MREAVAGTAVVVLTLSALGLGCRVQTLKHDQAVAAREAEAFLRHLVVEQDVSAAHAMFSKANQRELSVSRLETVLKEQHPAGYPTGVHATEYEPVPGQAAISIFLVGESESQRFYYRVPMLGTATSGYHPGGFYQRPSPYPPSSLRQALGR